MTPMEHATLGRFGNKTDGIKAPNFDGSQPCRSYNLNLFFPDSRVEEEEAKRLLKPVCDSCHFQSACLEWALENRECGIWAGTTDDERRSILRRRKRLAHK